MPQRDFILALCEVTFNAVGGIEVIPHGIRFNATAGLNLTPWGIIFISAGGADCAGPINAVAGLKYMA
jgi:hypothetical protein